MRTTPSTVSVIIPIHNSLEYLEPCLESVRAQTRPPDELVLVDDRGTDGSISFAEGYLSRTDIPYTVVTLDRNRGVGYARNAGLAASSGDLVWFLDSDDRAEPTFIDTLANALEREDADFVAARTLRVAEDNSELGIDEPRCNRPAITGEEFAHLLICGDAKGYACNKVFRRTTLGERPWDESQSYEDIAPLVRLALRARTVALVDAPLYRYLYREGSISTAFNSGTLDLFKVSEDVTAALADRNLDGPWRADLLGFRYREVLTSVAHVAMRARHSSPLRPALYDNAIRQVRAAARRRDFIPLARAGYRREAVFAVFIKTAPELYSAILRYR